MRHQLKNQQRKLTPTLILKSGVTSLSADLFTEITPVTLLMAKAFPVLVSENWHKEITNK